MDPLRWGNGVPFRVIVGFTCILSMCGAMLIVVSYVFFKSLRNRARLILVHISLMDFGTVVSKFVGNSINFEQYYVTHNASCTIYHTPQHSAMKGLCEGQAFFVHFFTVGSVLWTISLSVYLYFLLMHYRTSYAQMSHYASYFLCYGLSLLVSLWLLRSDKLGYNGEVFCGIIAVNLLTGQPNRYAAVFGYDLWVYFTMTFVPVLYLAVHLYLRDKVCHYYTPVIIYPPTHYGLHICTKHMRAHTHVHTLIYTYTHTLTYAYCSAAPPYIFVIMSLQLKQSKQYLRDGEERFKEALTILDYRFFLIPIMFALLRMWTCMQFLFSVYVQLTGLPPVLKRLVFYLSVSLFLSSILTVHICIQCLLQTYSYVLVHC